MIYRRGRVWWYEFSFQGQRIRESANTDSKTMARQAELQRRRDLERQVNRIEQPKKTPLFKIAAAEWLAGRVGLQPHTLATYRTYARTLTDRFGGRLVIDFNETDITDLIRQRQAEGYKPRRINLELTVLRMILRDHGLWDSIKGRTKPLRTPHDVGKQIDRQDEERLLDAIRQSRSPALLPLFILSIDTGLRASEVRHLRYRDLALEWKDGSIERGWLTVSRSKTEGGTGRGIPLTRRACAVLSLWLPRFQQSGPDSYIFPSHHIGGSRNGFLFGVDLNRPMNSWKTGWHDALKTAGLKYRWHDLRHTFVSRLAENPAVSEGTIMALAGHVSKAMLARYSHIRVSAKQAAIDTMQREIVNYRNNFEREEITDISPKSEVSSCGENCGESQQISVSPNNGKPLPN